MYPMRPSSQCAFLLLCLSSLLVLVPGEPMKIRPKLCSNAIGEEGTCMFVWECIKTEGKHLGTCVDGFLFGSCCGHNDSVNSLESIDSSVEPSVAPVAVELTTSTTTSSIITKDKIKNKWKPASTIHTALIVTGPSTPAPTTWQHTPSTARPPTTAVAQVFPTRNATTSSTIPPQHFNLPSTKRPATTSRPWIIYTGNRPLSTYRPAIISALVTNKPSHIHLPLLSNIPNKNFTTHSRPRPPIVTSNVWEFSETTSKIPSAIATPSTTPLYSALSSSESATPTESSSPEPPASEESIARPPSEVKYQCGVTQVRPRTKVVGGKNSAFGAWPWQVSVRRTHFFGFSSTHRCGGAILNNQWIATAGHCVDDLLLTQIRIRVGEYDFSSALEPFPHIERGAKKKIVHPKYNFFTYENDLALVQLDEPIDFHTHISPICLPPDNVNLLGKNATVTGWGRLSEGGVLPTVLQEVRVPIVSNDKCKNMFLSAGRHEYIPDIFMCAGFDEGGHDSCQGDSGGPLQVQGEDGHWFLAGIISWGIGCGEPSLPGVCTRISKFRQWILSYISN